MWTSMQEEMSQAWTGPDGKVHASDQVDQGEM